MNSFDLQEAFDRLKFGEDAFHELMRWRIRRVLLVLPQYDAWILEHDAKLSDQIVGEYHQLNLTTVPRLTTVSDGEVALDLLGKKDFDLMIIGMRVGHLSPGELATRAKELCPNIPVLMLLSSRSDLAVLAGGSDEISESSDENADTLQSRVLPAAGSIDSCFLWSGDSRLFLAMIKYVEDLRNAPEDTIEERVGVLLVVEDSIPFYSAYLPLLYGEIMHQTQRLIAEEMNDSDKYWRMRTRPKVLLARTWEEAVSLGDRYSDALIGIISDVSFTREGQLEEKAGFALAERFRSMGVTVPVLFQSSDHSMVSQAEAFNGRFQGKRAGNLHRGIRQFILEELGFGDFVFRLPDETELARARTLREFELALDSIPDESILFHAGRDDYSRWMAAHGEYQVARRIKPVQSDDFSGPEAQREFLARSFREIREKRHRGRLVEYRFDDPGAPGSVARYGSGSLGGKGRGLAFFNAVLNASPWSEAFDPLKVEIPRTLIIATGEFDRFVESSELPPAVGTGDRELRELFLESPLDEELERVLRSFLERELGPLAVRSSALLEDSQSMPFAGVYETYMLPGGDTEVRYQLLSEAIRLVWASTFSGEAVAYRNALGIGMEEEKMAVVIQRVAASRHGDFWFPRLSGTAQSLNYYPVGPMDRDDGAARIAVGLGRSVVGGDRGFLFCPAYPAVPWGTEEDRWREGQTHFWSLRALSGADSESLSLIGGEGSTLERLTIREAEEMDTLNHMASTWDPVGHRLVDGLDTPGARVVDFRDILDYEWIPLAPLLKQLMKISRSAMGIPVELEFVVDWKGLLSDEAVFSLLQVRPLISQVGPSSAIPERQEDEKLLLRSEMALGHGVVEGITRVVWVDPALYDPGNTESYRDDVAALMNRLDDEGESAVLIGPGRWGSRDRFLGIPVSWSQVRQARLIVEVSREPGDPEPSQGSHFFHNLVALGVGYAHISMSTDIGFVDWKFLEKSSQDGREGAAVRIAEFSRPATIVMDGRNGATWIVGT